MNNLKKFLVTLIMAVVICGGFRSVAFAEGSEDQTGIQTEESAAVTDTAVTAQEEQALEEGYFIDEQGQMYFDETRIEDEEAAADVTEKETDSTVDAEASEDAADEDKEASKDSKKDDTKDKAKVKEPAYSKTDLRLLSCLVYAESGNQSYETMLGVANVVLNRVKSDVYWHVNTIKEVIYDRKWSVQFAVTIKGKSGVSSMDKALKAYDSGKYSGGNPKAEENAMKKAIKAAKAALNGENNIGSYLCFSNKAYKSYVKKHYSKYEIIDDMIFFRKE